MRYNDIRAKKLVQIAANNLPDNPAKAKALLMVALADSKSVDIFGGDIYEYISEKEAEKPQEGDTPQEEAEDRLDDATEDETPKDNPDSILDDDLADRGEAEDKKAGSDQERLLDGGDRARLLGAALAARYKGKIGLAHQIELSLSADLISSLQEILMHEACLFDTRIAYLHLGAMPGSVSGIHKMQSLLLQIGAEPTLTRMALQSLPERSMSGLATREKAIISQLHMLYEGLLAKLDIANPVESELYLGIKDLQSHHQTELVL